MTLFRNRFRIESARCASWDYSSPGNYFVTICTCDRIRLFGNVQNSEMRLNEYGGIVAACWNDLPNHYHCMCQDSFCIMPNHVHAVIRLTNDSVVAVSESQLDNVTDPDIVGSDADNVGDNNNVPIVVSDSIVETGLKPVSTMGSDTMGSDTMGSDTMGTNIMCSETTVSGTVNNDIMDSNVNTPDILNGKSKPLRRHGLSEIVRAFKTFSSRRINKMRGTPGMPVWQQRFHDRIVRDERELYRVRRYVRNNPRNWQQDDLFLDT